MMIETSRVGDVHTLSLTGMLDASGGAILESTVQEMIRAGVSRIALDLTTVTFISSAGIRVLVTSFHKFRKLNGSFTIEQATGDVGQVLKMTGILKLLSSDPASSFRPEPAGESFADAELTGVIYRLGDHTLTGQTLGNPGLLSSCGFSERDCQRIEMGRSTLGIGLGSLGNNFAESTSHFGEFLSVRGATVCQLGDGTRLPDYLLKTEELIPAVNVLYGVQVGGEFSRFLRFEHAAECAAVRLHTLATRMLSVAQHASQMIAFVMVAESEGLIGATLRSSPAATVLRGTETLFSFPGVRRRLAFSADPIHRETTVLVAGILGASPPPELTDFVRPMTPDSRIWGHVHSAVFGYETLPAGQIDLDVTLDGFFRRSQPEAVVHLMYDDRHGANFRESEFSRGAIWFGPVNFSDAGKPAGDM